VVPDSADFNSYERRSAFGAFSHHLLDPLLAWISTISVVRVKESTSQSIKVQVFN